MIDSVSGSSMMMPVQYTANRLSSDQQTTIEETLAQFDLSNLSKEDATAIVDAFDEAGIEPGRALESALVEAGADAKEIGDLAGVKGPAGNRPPPPPPAAEEAEDDDSTDALGISSVVDYLEELLADRDISALSDADKQDIYSQLAEHLGLNDGDSLVKISV